MPVIIAELYDKVTDTTAITAALREIAVHNELTRTIEHFLIHPNFPVDIRHNAKIFREKLGIWAGEQMSSGKGDRSIQS